MDFPWPGNVRQLEASIERAALLCEREEIQVEDLPPEIRRPVIAGLPPFQFPPGGLSLERLERTLIDHAMVQSGGVIAKAAKLLGLSYKTLQYRLEKIRTKETTAHSNTANQAHHDRNSGSGTDHQVEAH
jgi:DNA-binding NtrC family response regulator